MASATITVIGSLNKDLVTRLTRIPSAGETITANSFSTGSGGKGANQAVACARLSKYDTRSKADVHVRMIGCVGFDSFGQELIDGLNNDGVDTTGVELLEGEITGVSVIVVEEDTGENRIMFSPGANYSLTPERFIELPLPTPDLIVLQMEIPLETVLQVLEIARKHAVDVLLNPAPALELPQAAYQAITHLVLNETEAALLSQSSSTDWGSIATKFRSDGVKNVVITLGAEGAFFATSEQSGRVSADKVQVVDTTGAGDTFVGAYAVSVAKATKTGQRPDISEAVRRASKAAAFTVQKPGAQSAIPFMAEMPET